MGVVLLLTLDNAERIDNIVRHAKHDGQAFEEPLLPTFSSPVCADVSKCSKAAVCRKLQLVVVADDKPCPMLLANPTPYRVGAHILTSMRTTKQNRSNVWVVGPVPTSRG